MNETAKQFGKIDYFLYFATCYHSNEVTAMNDTKIIQKLMYTNFTRPVQAISAAIPVLQQHNGQVGLIMNEAGGHFPLMYNDF